jgi:transcription factor SPN1
MSDVEDSPAGSPPKSLHDEDEDDQPKDSDIEAGGDDSGKDSDDDDDLSEIDEGQFGDYDPSAAHIKEKQPVEIDEDVAKTLKAGKRKGQAVKKPKEGRRDKKKRGREDDNDGADGEIMTGKRVRKSGATESKKASPEPVNEADLTPDERRRRAIERASNKDFKKPTKRRKKADEDVRFMIYYLRLTWY